MRRYFFLALALLAHSALSPQPATLFAQGTAFTYQGQLWNNAHPASGTYNLSFTLFNADTGGSAIAGPATNSAVRITNGLFTVLLDFGPGAFTGATNWLEINVKTNGAKIFNTLAPRQPLTPVPYAIYAKSASASGLSGKISAAQLPSSMITNGSSGVNLIGTFSGNGGGLTNVNAATVTMVNAASNLSQIVSLIPPGVVFWDNFQRNAVFTNGGCYAPSLAPNSAAGTRYLWYNPQIARPTQTNQFINGYLGYVTPPTNHDIENTFPTVALRFKPTYFGGRFRCRASGISGANQYPSIIFVCGPNLSDINSAYHISYTPQGGYNSSFGFWSGGLSNVVSSITPPGYAYASYGQDFTFQVWIDGNTATVDMGPGGKYTVNDPRIGQFGGQYLSYEIYNIQTNDVYYIDTLAVWAGINLNPTFSGPNYRDGSGLTNLQGTFTGNGSGLTNTAAIRVLTNAAPPIVVPGSGYFWPSNYDLYWVTPTRTNLIILGH